MADLKEQIIDYLAEHGEVRSYDLVKATWRGKKFGTSLFRGAMRNLLDRGMVLKRREPAGCYTKVFYRLPDGLRETMIQ